MGGLYGMYVHVQSMSSTRTDIVQRILAASPRAFADLPQAHNSARISTRPKKRGVLTPRGFSFSLFRFMPVEALRP